MKKRGCLCQSGMMVIGQWFPIRSCKINPMQLRGDLNDIKLDNMSIEKKINL